ncbi:hypothetical protein DV451_000393 [Geotrichum candidum]|uniref:Elongation of fatty acids protein n=1 Tax=Geotrichum candidum TaxID=1173061 RepID=A0A0J9X7E4_GEOCN|nr:hypothetical protein DV451_000393 [Geotrichum candidum]KAI9214965.1 hypothetical protein DS838_000131 [Geotrichum bryndzae]KAF5107453.1 hypothetical protein DV453_003108 [Geotrichum candidum]KAF5112535.1 hypothetical protein DV454_004148 [Geotrichum candidum]KAF5122833.1 hypothetical protein DV452_000511 [Geotrichum candidum]
MSNATTQGVYLSTPTQDLFTWPSGHPLYNGPGEGTFLSQYHEFFMDVRVPITIAAVYATSVHICNRIRKTNKEPLAISKTAFFRWFVLLHNIGLCVYSAWTFIGMTSGISKTVYEISNSSQNAGSLLVATKGSNFWRSLCDTNEGIWDKSLSFYGYYFYLSKFYEVFDTIIILAKGRQSSLLQTYHHAGAMLSMWAGVRYASPPIWIFVVFNSLIHTIMYFYYTISALKVPVPRILKRALTTAQICQFVFGGSFALMHGFINYFNATSGEYCSCLDTPGKLFALAFNVSYLAPLTYLFVMFWIDSYVRGWKKGAQPQVPAKEQVIKTAQQPSKDVSARTRSKKA